MPGVSELKKPPAYAIASVDHALRVATMLQLEESLTVRQVADRLGVARSTAHRLLAMLVYRDYAVQDDERVYHVGTVLQLATHSRSRTSRLRAAALPQMQRLVDRVHETVNVAVLVGDTARFVASVECQQSLRVSSREGMVFPAHRTTAGLLLLAELAPHDLSDLFDEARFAERHDERPDLEQLDADLDKIRRSGFALNREHSERGVVALGVTLRESSGEPLAGLSVSMPTVRYDQHRLPEYVAMLRSTAVAIERSIAT